MTLFEFKDQYPRLFRLLNIISFSNEMTIREEMGDFSQTHLYELNIEAAGLAEEEYEVMADGEESERKALVKKKDLWALDDFLESCFDGDLSPEVYVL